MLTLSLEARPAHLINERAAEASWAAVRADHDLSADGTVPLIKANGNTKLDHEMERNGGTLIASHTLPSGRVHGTCTNDTHCADTCVVEKSIADCFRALKSASVPLTVLRMSR